MSTPELIRTAVERFQAEVPALAKLKLVFGIQLRAKHDIQLLPGRAAGPEDHQGSRPGRAGADRNRPAPVQPAGRERHARQLPAGGETGHIKATGDSNVVKLVTQVVEKQEQRARLRKVH